MKVLERTIQLYRKVDNNEPMEEMHKRVMEGLSKIEAPLGLKDSEITGIGTHQELLESNQEYIELAKSQGILE